MRWLTLLPCCVLLLAAGEPTAAPVRAVAYSPDGTTLAIASRGLVTLLDGFSHELLDELPGLAANVTALGFSRDSRHLAVADGEPGKVGRVHLFTRQAEGWVKTRTLEGPKDLLHAVAFKPDGNQLAAAGYSPSVYVWNLKDGALAATLKDHSDSVYDLAFAPGGNMFATAAADRTAKLWDAAKLERRHTLGQATDWLYTVAFSPDGKLLATGGVDKSLRLYRLGAGEPELITSTFAHAGSILKVAFLGDGQRLVTLGEDRLVKVWSVQPLKEVRTLPALPDTGLTLAVHPRDARAAVGTYDGRLLLLNLDTGETLPPAWPSAYPLTKFDASAARTVGQRLPTPATLVGQLSQPGVELRFLLELRSGQELGVQVQKLPGSQLDPHLALLDEAGKEVARDLGTLLAFPCPHAGRYTLTLRDEQYRGGAGFGFRLKVGPLPIVTSIFPLGAQRGAKVKLTVKGVNLGKAVPTEVAIPAEAGVGSRHALHIPSVLNPPSLLVGEFAEAAASGTLLVPGSGQGIAGKSDWHITAKQGQRLLIEVHARRLDSPLDPVLQVLDAKGQPIPRAVLRPTSRVYTTLRDHDSRTAAIRFEAMDGFAMGDYLWLPGELLKIEEMPRNPDDDCRFHQRGGQRLGQLGTTPRQQGLGTAAYKVELHPPGAAFPPGGYPAIPLFCENDDGGGAYGKDCYLVFDPPLDGEYRLRVTDALGRTGSDLAYRVTVRPPRPDFKVNVEPKKLALAPGTSQALYLSAERIDEFEGEIEIKLHGMPKGWTCPPTYLGEGVNATAVVLTATPDAQPVEAEKVTLIATATLGGKKVSHFTPLPALTLAKPGDLTAATVEDAVAIVPGGRTKLTVKIERKGDFKKRVPIEVRGLPYGVRVDDVGLNGVLITEGETQRTFTLYAEPWVKPQEKPLAVIAKREGGGEAAAPSVWLKVQAAHTKTP